MPPIAVNVVDFPEQIEISVPAFMVGEALTVTTTASVAEQFAALVPVTV